jgi:hypothetical protein
VSFTVKLDEALSRMLVRPLQDGGYVVRTVKDQGWGGLKDSKLWPKLLAEKVFFITADRGFGDIRSYPPGTHEGILILRPDRESLPECASLLGWVIQQTTIRLQVPRGFAFDERKRRCFTSCS